MTRAQARRLHVLRESTREFRIGEPAPRLDPTVIVVWLLLGFGVLAAGVIVVLGLLAAAHVIGRFLGWI